MTRAGRAQGWTSKLRWRPRPRRRRTWATRRRCRRSDGASGRGGGQPPRLSPAQDRRRPRRRAPLNEGSARDRPAGDRRPAGSVSSANTEDSDWTPGCLQGRGTGCEAAGLFGRRRGRRALLLSITPALPCASQPSRAPQYRCINVIALLVSVCWRTVHPHVTTRVTRDVKQRE